MLTFAYAEVLETKGSFAEVHATFDKLLSALRADLEALEGSANSANSPVAANNGVANGNGGVAAGADAPMTSSFNTQASDEKPPKELAERRTEYGLAYIMYMRFGRRAEGVKSSRSAFTRARKDRWTPWEVYEAAGEKFNYTDTTLD